MTEQPEYATFNDPSEQSDLKFTKPDPQREEYVADTSDVTYRVSRDHQGIWEVRATRHDSDDPPIVQTFETQTQALALADFIKKAWDKEKVRAEGEAKADELIAKIEALMAKPWRELTWKERLSKGSVVAAAAAAGGVVAYVTALLANSGQPSVPTYTYTNPADVYDPVRNFKAQVAANQQWTQQHQQQQWMPWMSQGYLNPYDGQTYYPIHYGTRF